MTRLDQYKDVTRQQARKSFKNRVFKHYRIKRYTLISLPLPRSILLHCEPSQYFANVSQILLLSGQKTVEIW
jgi:hypothetical protein